MSDTPDRPPARHAPAEARTVTHLNRLTDRGITVQPCSPSADAEALRRALWAERYPQPVDADRVAALYVERWGTGTGELRSAH